MSLLSIVSSFCERTGIPAPTTVIGSQDSQILQIKGLLNEVLVELCDRWTWTDLVYECVFQTVASEDQGALAVLASNGFLSIIPETFFDRTLRRPVHGPIGREEWQALHALPFTGPLYRFRIIRGWMRIFPVPVAGHTMAFEYKSNLCVTPASGPSKSSFTADSDTSVFGDDLLILGLRYIWKREKGLDYAEELRSFESMANNRAVRDGGKRRICLADVDRSVQPGIFVPYGNWGVP